MKIDEPSICALLIVASESAFLQLSGVPILLRSFETLRRALPARTIYVGSTSENADRVCDLLDTREGEYELLFCNPQEPKSIAASLLPFLRGYDSVVVHDASRPLVDDHQFERVFSAFTGEIDAVRPWMVISETLKILSPTSEILDTVDRSTVKWVSTPELYKISSIDWEGANCGWFLPLKTGVQIELVEGNAESVRINTAADRDLQQLLLE